MGESVPEPAGGDSVYEHQKRRLEEVNRELRELIRDAAAGGLRLETIGVFLFALGIGFGLWGNLVS